MKQTKTKTNAEKSKISVTMASPWVVYAKKVEALFAADPDVKVEFDCDNVKLTIYATGLMGKKAEAIEKLLPSEVKMGNVTLTTEVIPGDDEPTYEDYVKMAFFENGNFSGVKSESHGMMGSSKYGLFKNTTTQFYADDLSQYGGMNTFVVADIAKEILNPESNFYFSTELS